MKILLDTGEDRELMFVAAMLQTGDKLTSFGFKFNQDNPKSFIDGLRKMADQIESTVSVAGLEQASSKEEIKGILDSYTPEYLASCGIV